MALEDILGAALNLPMQYGQLFNQQFSPAYNFASQRQQGLARSQGELANLGVQGATSLGSTGLNLYGQLSQLEQDRQRFNSVAPVLGGLLSSVGFSNIPGLQQIGFSPMTGYGGVMGGAYDALGRFQDAGYGRNDQASRQFDGDFDRFFNWQSQLMPSQPYGTGGLQGSRGPFGPTPQPNYGGYQPPQPSTGGSQDPYAMYRSGWQPYAGSPPTGGAMPPPGMNVPAAPQFDEDAVRYSMENMQREYGVGAGPQQSSYDQNKFKQLRSQPVGHNDQMEAMRRLGQQWQTHGQLKKYAPQSPQQAKAFGQGAWGQAR